MKSLTSKFFVVLVYTVLGVAFSTTAFAGTLQLTLSCANNIGEVGVAYSSGLVVSGGTPPYTFSIIAGGLPDGLTLDPSSGNITGTPSKAGSFNYAAQVIDSNANSATSKCNIKIHPAVSVDCPSKAQIHGAVGEPLSAQLLVFGGVAPFTFSVVNGSLPPGVTLNPSTGLISGTPTMAGRFTFSVQVVDSLSATFTVNCQIFIAPPLTLTCPTNTGQVGVPYSSSLVATGGVPPYTFSIVSGSLPPGLTLNPTTGAITGTPTTAGTFNFTAQVVDSNSAGATSTTASCSIIISPPALALTCASANAQVGVPYSSALVATGGVPPYAFSIISGSLPPGLTLNPTTGAITGTPTTEGTYNYTAKVVDSTGATVTTACSITVAPQQQCLTQDTNKSNFNGTKINAGSYIWFNANFTASGIPSAGATIFLQNSEIQFTANNTNYNLAVPNAQITFSPTATCTSTSFDTSNNTWITVTPLQGEDEVFLSGLAFPVPAGGLPGGINPVNWVGGFGSDTAGVTVHWKWGAAVYTTFTTNYSTLDIKPGHQTSCSYQNSDHAGTPEGIDPVSGKPFKDFVIGGARGGGGSNWTGSWSSTDSVVACH